ncbi:BON domain-containing protein [Ensifer canadensis]|uniref:BON domain-containing protein n=1 Tax=Ensifer canadensis TaxID=555315 RepID=UPI001CEF2066|nr:BON domain-containing protein [Ensifer canadensis]
MRQESPLGPFQGRGPKAYPRSDCSIEEVVKDRLTLAGTLDATEIEVSVYSGEVVLSGTVNSKSARRQAEEIAEGVRSVSHVRNNLRVDLKQGHLNET